MRIFIKKEHEQHRFFEIVIAFSFLLVILSCVALSSDVFEKIKNINQSDVFQKMMSILQEFATFVSDSFNPFFSILFGGIVSCIAFFIKGENRQFYMSISTFCKAVSCTYVMYIPFYLLLFALSIMLHVYTKNNHYIFAATFSSVSILLLTCCAVWYMVRYNNEETYLCKEQCRAMIYTRIKDLKQKNGYNIRIVYKEKIVNKENVKNFKNRVFNFIDMRDDVINKRYFRCVIDLLCFLIFPPVVFVKGLLRLLFGLKDQFIHIILMTLLSKVPRNKKSISHYHAYLDRIFPSILECDNIEKRIYRDIARFKLLFTFFDIQSSISDEKSKQNEKSFESFSSYEANWIFAFFEIFIIPYLSQMVKTYYSEREMLVISLLNNLSSDFTNNTLFNKSLKFLILTISKQYVVDLSNDENETSENQYLLSKIFNQYKKNFLDFYENMDTAFNPNSSVNKLYNAIYGTYIETLHEIKLLNINEYLYKENNYINNHSAIEFVPQVECHSIKDRNMIRCIQLVFLDLP